MEKKFFLAQIKRTNGVWEKGIVVKDTLDEVRQSYYAYFGAYGFGKQANTDYVMCYTFDSDGAIYDKAIDNRIAPDPEPEAEPEGATEPIEGM